VRHVDHRWRVVVSFVLNPLMGEFVGSEFAHFPFSDPRNTLKVFGKHQDPRISERFLEPSASKKRPCRNLGDAQRLVMCGNRSPASQRTRGAKAGAGAMHFVNAMTESE
jgi:hypothetical protein